MTTRLRLPLAAASLALTLGLALSLTGCASSGVFSEAVPPVGVGVTGGDAGAGMSGMTDTMPVDGKSAIGTASSTVVDRSTIETAYLSVSVTAPEKTVADAQRIATEAGGFVQDSSWNPANQYGPESAYLTVRVPVDKLDAVLAQFGSLGKVDSLSRSKTDVTLTLTDLNARIASLQQSLDNLRTLQAQASNVSDLITVEAAIASRQAELDSLVAQQTYLSDQVDMSTISLTLTGSTGATPTNNTFWDGLVAGWNSLAVAGSALLVAVGFVLPWIVLLAIVAGIVLAVIFAVLRRRRETASAGSTTKASATGAPSATKTAAKTTTKK